MATNKQVADALRFDALDTAEKLMGGSIHVDDPLTMAVGIGLMQANAAAKERMLTDRGDTTFSNKLDRYCEIVEAYGFEQVLCLPFENDRGEPEQMFVYATRDGLLLRFDTYNALHVNAASVYYNWRYSAYAPKWECTSSGHGTEDGVWVGNHDAREALLFNMDRLKARGELLSPWIEQPFLWLLHYMDTKSKGYDYNAINGARIAMLPEWVRQMILAV